MFGLSGSRETRFAVPPLAEAAFLLDFDGTLVDAVRAADDVVVPPGLTDVLAKLRAACGDALAIISRRPVEEIDRLLGDVPFAVAGERGIAIRHRPGGPIERAALPPLPQHWLARARDLVGTLPGTRLEHKDGGLILHYRAAPEAATTLRTAAAGWVSESKGEFLLQPGHMMWEIRPVGVDKGYAVSQVMQAPPFIGRKPVYVGDDHTDEEGVQTARQQGGVGFRISADFPTPAVFRAWLASLVAAR